MPSDVEADIPRLRGIVGTGYDISSGDTCLPVVKLSYDSSSKTYNDREGNSFLIPNEAKIMKHDLMSDDIKNFLFKTENDYAATWDFDPEKKTGAAIGGLLSHSETASSLYDQFFQESQSVVVTEEYHWAYELVLDGALLLDDSLEQVIRMNMIQYCMNLFCRIGDNIILLILNLEVLLNNRI